MIQETLIQPHLTPDTMLIRLLSLLVPLSQSNLIPDPNLIIILHTSTLSG